MAKDPRREAARDLMRELLEEAEIRRIEELTPEQMEQEAKASGLAPGEGLEMLRRAIAAVDAPAAQPSPAAAPVPETNGTQKVAGPGPAKVVSLDERRRRSRIGLYALVAAAALVLLVLGVVWRDPMMRQQIDAWFSPAPTVPSHPIVPRPHEETPKEKADRLREDAYVDIQKGYFDYAWDELEDASELDPDGNLDPRVRQAYKDIEDGPPKPPLYRSKPQTQDWERPLKKQAPSPH